jgi:hypothetical protein
VATIFPKIREAHAFAVILGRQLAENLTDVLGVVVGGTIWLAVSLLMVQRVREARRRSAAAASTTQAGQTGMLKQE